eukprot:GHVS01034383.1.p1 GENE.GHVS01034383.1~~GHVS01034383.1.p1  ORF type:complete len:421 (-),score=42.91 GHVS01034383.1:85-1281(-)
MRGFYFLPYFLWLSPWGSRDSRQGGNLLGVGAELAGHDERVNEEIDASPQENFLHPPRLLTLGNGASTPASNNPVAAIPVAADPKPEDAQKPSQSADTLDADFSAMVENIVTESEHPPKGAPKPLGPQEAMQTEEEALRSQAKKFYHGKLTNSITNKSEAMRDGLQIQIEHLRYRLEKDCEAVHYCMFTGPGAPDIRLAIMPQTNILCLINNGKKVPVADALPKMEGCRWESLHDKHYFLLKPDPTSADTISPLAAKHFVLTYRLASYIKMNNSEVAKTCLFQELSTKGGDKMQKMSQLMFEAFRFNVSFTALAAAIFCLVQTPSNQFEDMAELFAEISIAFMHGVKYAVVYHNNADPLCKYTDRDSFKFSGYKRLTNEKLSKAALANALDNIRNYEP